MNIKKVFSSSMLGLGLVVSANALANPAYVPDNCKMDYKFNVLGYPKTLEYTGGCGNGHRIFVNRDAGHAHILVTDGAGNGWDIIDCNATADNTAHLQTDDLATYDVYVRILGKPGGRIKICADTLVDHTNGDHMCLLGTIDLTRGSGRSKLGFKADSIFDASMENIMWSVETNDHFRIAEFRAYRCD